MKKVTFDNFENKKLKLVEDGILYGKRQTCRNLGNCRCVFRIDEVMIKYDDVTNGGDRRYKTYRQTSSECRIYKKIKPNDLKYFARTKSFKIKGKLIEIQERIKGRPYSEMADKNKTLSRLEKKYKLQDLHYNNVIMVNDQPIIVDFGL